MAALQDDSGTNVDTGGSSRLTVDDVQTMLQASTFLHLALSVSSAF